MIVCGHQPALCCLVIEINQSAVELARLQRLRAAAITFWMAALLGGPRRKRGQAMPPDEAAAWGRWFATVGALLTEVGLEVEAWQSLQQRYLGGTTCLFPDAHGAWAGLEDHVGHLERMAEMLRPAFLVAAAAESAELSKPEESTAAAAAARARFLADNARVKAFELLGERPRAARIVERRLRTDATAGPTL